MSILKRKVLSVKKILKYEFIESFHNKMRMGIGLFMAVSEQKEN